MANEIFNMSGAATGNQSAGLATFRQCYGKVVGRLGESYSPRGVKTIDISVITDDYTDRLDDPRYYTGDAKT